MAWKFNPFTGKLDYYEPASAAVAGVASFNTRTGDISLLSADVTGALGFTPEGAITAGTTAQYWRGDKSWQTLNKSAVGLSNVDNTSDANKPISTATQTALDAKQSLDTTLTSLAAYNTNGLLTQTAADTFTGRTITGTSNQVIVTNGNGVSGNPTLSLPQNIHTAATPQFSSMGVGTAAVANYKLFVDSASASDVTGFFRNSASYVGSNWALQVVGYTDLNGFRINGADTTNSIYSATQFGFTASNGNAILFSHYPAGERMRIHTDGSIGIGTNSPTHLFHVRGTAATPIVRFDGGAGTGYFEMGSGDTNVTGYISWRKGDTTRLGYMGFSSSNVALTLENSAAFTVSGGSVGIGDTTPDYLLDVAGTFGADGAATFGSTASFAGDVTVPDEAYGSGWNGSTEVPTKNAVYDKIETVYQPSGTDVAVADGGTGASTAASARTNLGAATIADIQVFTSSGTWTKPTDAKFVEIVAIGGGGGGGSGRRGASLSARSGGGGGAGGGMTTLRLQASLLGATETVTVGTGGAGGTGITANDTNGNPGVVGNNSSFGSWVVALGGSFGGGGTNSTGAAGGAVSSSIGPIAGSGGAGAAGATTAGGTGGTSTTTTLSRGGGGGGGISTGDVSSAGGAGGDFSVGTLFGVIAGGTAGTAPGGTGGNGNDRAVNYAIGGTGGGGGGAATAAAGGTGGNGGKYGAGGGGGGASQNGQTSGAGGNGASGIVTVISYF